eukprot:GFKZ01002596.1.p1 GENE.GFKZ01002596.1~~GFKZ01002596.1.p1  ORF type:complete len:362 (+),score=56.97 GFKZ01002596.1:536-1621(+)
MFAVTVLVCLVSYTTALYYKDVTASDFDSLIDSSKASIMLEFYAPWCGHCKNLAPDYEKLGNTFERQSDVIIAQVDADKHKSLAKRFDIKGFPTLKWVQKGSDVNSAIDVESPRTAEGLLDYVNSKTGLSKTLKSGPPSNVTPLTDSNFDTIALDKDKHVFVGFFAPWCGHCKAMKPDWEKLAELYVDEPNVVVASVDCDAYSSLAEKYEVGGFPTLKFSGLGDVDFEDYSGGRQLDDLVSYVNEKSGLDLSVDGGVVPSGGIVKGIDDHVKSFMSAASDEDRKKALDTCQAEVEKLDTTAQSNFKYYVKVFNRITEKGVEYIKKEKERLSKVLETSQGLKPTQRRSFLRRINVLSAFDEL